MLPDGIQKLLRRIVEKTDLSRSGGIVGILLLQHLDHHVVGRLVDEGDQDLLPVQDKIVVCILLHGGLRDLPYKVPGEHVRQLVSQLLHEGFVHIAGFGGAHVRHGIIVSAQHAFIQKFGNDLLLCRSVHFCLTSAKSVILVIHQLVQGNHHIAAGHIGGDMVRIGDADIGRRLGGDVGDDIVVDLAVIRIKPQVYVDIGIQCLKVPDGLLINGRLADVRIIFRPESDLVFLRLVKGLGNGKLRPVFRSVTSRKQ